MDIEDTGLDIEILSEEEVFNENSDPVDVDIDVICTDDMCYSDDVQNGTSDDLPVRLLSAFKRDAAETAQAAASKRKFEGNSTATDSYSASYTTPSSSSVAISTECQIVSTSQLTVPATHQVVTTECQIIPTAHQGVSAASAVFAVDTDSISSAATTATVPKTTTASTVTFNPTWSCLSQHLPTAPRKDFFTNVTGGAMMNELVISNSIPLEDEWSCVETELIVPGKEQTSHLYTTQETTILKSEPVISFDEALTYFKSTDMSNVKPKIQQTVERHGISAWTHYFFGPPKLRNNLLPSKEMTFCMAATTFDNFNTVHVRSLLALYRNLTGDAIDCRRFGSHWEIIGFQGNDPSTDLRGVGIFGLLQLLYFTSKPELETLKKQIYKLSQHKTQNFPFCVMGLNLSKLVLQSLREDKLNRLCNKREDLVSLVNDVFVASYYKVYHIWKNQNKTIVDSGFVLKDVENQLRKSPQNLIKDLEEFLKNPNAAAPKKKLSKSSNAADQMDDFVGIADILHK